VQQLIIDALVPHHWSLAVASPDKGGFICSDSPLPWERGFTEDVPLHDSNVYVTSPLSKELALITRNYDRHKKRRYSYEANDGVVAWVNARTHVYSFGTLYSAGGDFLLLRKGNKIGHSRDFFAHTDNMRRAAPEAEGTLTTPPPR
jgi:hypothetical protein